MVIEFYSSDYGFSKKYWLICINFRKYNYFDISKSNNFEEIFTYREKHYVYKNEFLLQKIIVNA